MANIKWDGDDFRNEQSSSGTTADQISHQGKLQQGYKHGSLTQGLVAYYPMEKGEGKILHDAALDNIGQIKEATWTTETIVGNSALDFDGVDDTVLVDPFLESGLTNITVSVWVKIDDSWNNNWEPVIFDIGGYSMRLRSDDGSRRSDGNQGFGFHVHDGSSWSWDASIKTSSLSTGTWYNMIGIYRNGNLEFYVNGSLTGTDTSGTINTSSNTGSLMGEYDNNRRYKKGQISDLRIYNRALSKPEIQALANLSQPSGIQKTEEEVPGQEQGGVGRYRLNTSADDSWGDNHGTESGVTYQQPGVYGNAAEFNGTDDYIFVPNDSSLNVANITASIWVYHSNVDNSYETYFYKGSDIDNPLFSLFRRRSGIEPVAVFKTTVEGTVHGVATQTHIPQNAWTYITGTYDGSEMRIYYNGQLESTNNSMNGNIDTYNQEMEFGGETTRNDYYLNGFLDDARIYNTALNPVQVEKLFHKGAYRINRSDLLQ